MYGMNAATLHETHDEGRPSVSVGNRMDVFYLDLTNGGLRVATLRAQ